MQEPLVITVVVATVSAVQHNTACNSARVAD
eukprot:COSAG01_NODE_66156_length_271_cov_0.598837_2_plen_30_part_01